LGFECPNQFGPKPIFFYFFFFFLFLFFSSSFPFLAGQPLTASFFFPLLYFFILPSLRASFFVCFFLSLFLSRAGGERWHYGLEESTGMWRSLLRRRRLEIGAGLDRRRQRG
jgi:hypothetical protein